MRISSLVLLTLVSCVMLTGCNYIGTQVDLGRAAQNVGMTNITTGDGTFADYKATDHQRATEIGISVGIPFLWKFMELYPGQTNQEQVEGIARKSKAMGANAMINVAPPMECYTGFPFFIVGLHIDKVAGTGINVR